MNEYIINGNIGSSEAVNIANGKNDLVKFSVGVRRPRKKDGEWINETEWIRCVLWVKKGTANKRLEQFPVGAGVVVYGIPSARAWLDNNGEARAALELNVRSYNTFRIKGKEAAQNTSEAVKAANDLSEDQDDGLPF